MDLLITILAVVYGAQSIDVLMRKLGDFKKFPVVPVLILALIPTYFMDGVIFKLLLLIFLVFWSRLCRSSDFGFSYHFFLILGAGVAFGPGIGALIGFLPLAMVPFLKKDAQIIDLFFSIAIMTIAGVIAGFFGGLEATIIITYSVRLLVGINIVRAFFMFNKLPMYRVGFFMMANVALNYYLITYYMASMVGWLAP